MTDTTTRQAGLREAADFIAAKADNYAREFGVSDMGSLSFGNDDMRDYHWGLLELADEIRALAAQSVDASTTATAQRLTNALHYLQMGIANLELENGVHMVDFRNAERALLEKDRG